MQKFILFSLPILLSTGCFDMPEPSAKDRAAQKGEAMAEQALGNGNNAEQKNIEKRLKLTSQPGLIGYVVLLNEMGKPVLYTTVKGKITSGGKRLTQPFKEYLSSTGSLYTEVAPSDEGTWGSSSPYIYFWDTNDRYHQWSGEYLYSDQPIRMNEEPLVVSITEAQVPTQKPEKEKPAG